MQTQEAPNLPNTKQIPQGMYDLRIMEAKFSLSAKSGNKMLTFKVEIYAPAEITHNQGGVFTVAGKTCNKIVMLHNAQAVEELKTFMGRLGIPQANIDGLDTENPDTDQFVGKCFSDIVKPRKYEDRSSPTETQLKENPAALGDVIIDPETGGPMLSYGIETEFGTSKCRKARSAAPVSV